MMPLSEARPQGCWILQQHHFGSNMIALLNCTLVVCQGTTLKEVDETQGPPSEYLLKNVTEQ